MNNPTWPAYSTMANNNRVVTPFLNTIQSCFDRQTQNWQFKIIEGTIKLRWVYGFCPANVPLGSTLLDDITNVPSNYPCKDLKNDVRKHLIFNPNPGPNYFFKSLLKFHELAHMQLLQEYINYYSTMINIYYIEKMKKGCTEFNPNNQADLDKINNEIKNAVAKALKLAAGEYNSMLPYNTDYAKAMYTEEYLIHPKAVPDILQVLNSINCP